MFIISNNTINFIGYSSNYHPCEIEVATIGSRLTTHLLAICSKVVDWRFRKARGVPSEEGIRKIRRANAGGKETPLCTLHQNEEDRERHLLDLDKIARQGARRMLAEALEAEVEAYIEAATDHRDEQGRALVVRNGYARKREILLGAGAVELKAPRINDRRVDEDGNRQRFKSVILPSYMRRSPKVTEVLPLLYLHGLSSGDFVPVLEAFFGTEAGLSASTITRLSEQWQTERESFMRRDLSHRDYVYVWVDGIHTAVRLGADNRLCCLVMVGARLDGTKELVAISETATGNRPRAGPVYCEISKSAG